MITRCALALVLLSAACRTEAPAPPPAKAAEVPALYRAMVYSTAFAQRFALRQAGIEPLDDGLLALTLRVVEQTAQSPLCYLDLYVEDQLDLALPSGSEGQRKHPDASDPLFFVKRPADLGPELTRWRDRTASFHAGACSQTPSDCTVHETGLTSFARQLLPGIATTSYELACDVLDPKHSPAELWVLRAGRDPDALAATSMDRSATYRFRVPQRLLEFAAQRTRTHEPPSP